VKNSCLARPRFVGNIIFSQYLPCIYKKGALRNIAFTSSRFNDTHPSPSQDANMKKNHIPILRAVLAGTASAVLTFALASPASAASDAHSKMAHNWAEHQAHLQAHLAKEAERLGITASQQAQWQAYANAVESPIGNMHRLPPDADAVSITRQRADMAAGHAAKLVRIADATATLQAVLTPEQRGTFARMVRHAGPHGWHEARDRERPRSGNSGPAGVPAE
jgi:hypothetical protein